MQTDLRCALVFPGAGAQVPAMMWRLHRDYPVVRELLDWAEARTGLPLSRVCLQNDGAALNDVALVQPALFVTGVAAWAALFAPHDGPAVEPVAVAGHSLGHFAALACAGALDLDHAIDLVTERAALMVTAQRERPGAMASVVGLTEQQLADACRSCPGDAGVVTVACLNGETEIVVSGDIAAVDWLTDAIAVGSGVTVRRVASGVAAHSPLMAPVQELMQGHFDTAPLQKPALPIVLYTTGASTVSVAEIRADLAVHLTAPVRWSAVMNAPEITGADIVYDLGPGQSLARLIERNGRLPTAALNAMEPLSRVLRRTATGASGPSTAGTRTTGGPVP